MTVGALSAAILLVNRAMMPVSLLVGLIFRMRQGLKSAAPLAGLMTAPVEAGADRAASGARITGRLDFARVSFTYPGEARPALKEISLSIRAGEKVGLIGKAGCGKSTLLRLISCLNEPGEGRIALDGRDIRQFDPRDIRRAIGAMPQDSALVEGTLEDNLTLGLEAVPRAELERVCALAGVDEIASRHPSGHALEVGPGGQRLSGGERQCVSLARSLMGRPAMLLLDEPTSALDNTLEARVLAALKAELHDKGLIVATHRLQVLALVDRVIWLDGGRIVADGPKDDVFRKFGLVA
jgi:ATP-binding cassette subfamily C protein LapB